MAEPQSATAAKRCTAALWHDDRYLGTGFFIAPRTMVTCAHVLRRVTGDAVTVVWERRRYEATVLQRLPRRSPAGTEPTPDIAFLALEPLDNPYAMVDDIDPRTGDRLMVYGFSRYTPAAGIDEDAVWVRVVAVTGGFIKLDHGRLVHGLSGAPAFDQTGAVLGMAKTTVIDTDPDKDHERAGGWLVRGGDILRYYERLRIEHRVAALSKPILVRPDRGTPLHGMLTAQRILADEYPYRMARLTSRPPPPLSTVYVEQRTRRRRDGPRPRDRSIPASAQVQLTEQYLTPAEMIRQHRHALVVGGPGEGKSTLLQQLVSATASWWLREDEPRPGAEPELGPVVAIRLPATALLERLSWYDCVAAAVNRDLQAYQRFSVSAELFAGPPVAGAEWLVLVDGLDEVMDSTSRRLVISVIGQRVAEYGSYARFVVTSRRLDESEFRRLRGGLTTQDDPARLGEYQLRLFDDRMLTAFAQRWFRPPGHKPASVTPESFLTSVAESHIRPLVEVPLMATIAAVVHEENPEVRLADDRTGLYEQFVSGTLSGRRIEPGVREKLIALLADHGRRAEAVGEVMFDQRRQCLSFLADRRLRNDPRPLGQLAEEWLRRTVAALPDGLDQALIREYLLSTGLIEVQGDNLGFVHLSLAEYLASAERVRSFDPVAWVRRVERSGPDSLGLFTLGRWRRAGYDVTALVGALLPRADDLDGQPGEAVERRLLNVATLLEDGAVGEQVDGAVAGIDSIVRSPPAAQRLAARTLRRVVRAMLHRSSDPTAVRRLAADGAVPFATRIQAASVLARDGSGEDRAQGLDILASFAYGRQRRDPMQNLLAMAALAEVGDSSERRFAVQHLSQILQSHPSDAMRYRAMVLLQQLRQYPAAALALARRHVQTGGTANAVIELALINELSGDNEPQEGWQPPDDDSAAFDIGSRAWLPARRQARTGTRDIERHLQFGRSLADSIAYADLEDSPAAFSTIRSVLRDRGHGWYARVVLARTLRVAGLPHLAARALSELAEDPLERAPHRVLSVALAHLARPSRSHARIQGWATDPDQPPELRRAALEWLFRSPNTATATLARFLADGELPARLRLTVVLLVWRFGLLYGWTPDVLRRFTRHGLTRWQRLQLASAIGLVRLGSAAGIQAGRIPAHAYPSRSQSSRPEAFTL